MTLPSYAPGVNMNVDMIKNEAQRGGQWDINDAVYRRIAGMPSGQISFYDFYGKSFQETMYWDGNSLMNAYPGYGGSGWGGSNPIDAGPDNSGWPFCAWIWQYSYDNTPAEPDPGTGTPPDSGGCCFSPDSKVLMADMAYKPIIDIQIGEQIINDAGKISTVIGRNQTIVGSRKMVKFANSNFMCTEDHLFLTDKGWKTWDPAYLINNNRPNAVYLEGLNKTTPIQSGDKLRVAYQDNNVTHFNFVDYDTLGAVSFTHPSDYAVYDLDITDGVDDYIVEGFVVHNCAGSS